MRSLEELRKTPNLVIQGDVKDPKLQNGQVYHGWVDWYGFKGTVIFGYDEAGMEHVSISSYKRNQLPTWDDMCKLKDMFFYPEEMVVQLHPAESEYVHSVNGLENVLHLWRPKDGNWEMLNHPERWD